MRFGPVPIADAEGAILAHSLGLSSGKLGKGRVLTADDIRALGDDGFETVVVARLDGSDLSENDAALRIAQAVCGAGALDLSRPTTGRVNIYAAAPGIVKINEAAVQAVNSVDPMITVATVPQFHRCDPRTLVATIKIIAYGVPETAVALAEAQAAAAISLAAPVMRSATLIETVISGDVPSDKGRQAIHGRLARLGMTLAPRVIVAHADRAIADAIAAADGDLILILTASATSDPADVAPSAVRLAGGDVTRFGMPVDPGNLLFVGKHNGRPVVGLPGCARSPALNGADWVLERVICGETVADAEIAAMGVGGLLKEIPTRPSPREG